MMGLQKVLLIVHLQAVLSDVHIGTLLILTFERLLMKIAHPVIKLTRKKPKVIMVVRSRCFLKNEFLMNLIGGEPSTQMMISIQLGDSMPVARSRESLMELETTISLVLETWASTPLKHLHHRLVISPRRPVDSVLMILFQAPHFSAQAVPHKDLKTDWKTLLTFQDLIHLAHTIVYLYLLRKHNHQ